jgi:1-acyl-sn-glycerol-3-phosphate acyltransferase
MKIINSIAGRLMALWAILTFIAGFLIVFIPSMLCWLIPEPKGQDIFIRIARVWMNVWLRLVGCPITIKGKENFTKGKPFIVTFNHNSMMDIPLSCPYVPGPNKTIAKSSFIKIPLFGLYYIKGAVLVNRKNEESRRRSYEKMKKVLAKGMHMCIYPEGTRNRTGEPLKKFHDGAFRLAVETHTAIIPVILLNTKKVLPKGFWFRPQRLEMHFLPTVEPAQKTSEEIKNEVFHIMKEYYVQHQH